jgi:hypothetical protein
LKDVGNSRTLRRVNYPGQARQAAQRLLDAMSDEELRAQLLNQQTSSWRRPGLLEHHRRHRDEWPDLLGQATPSIDEYAVLGAGLIRTWDRAFLSIEQGGPTWLFVRRIDGDAGIVVATRRGRIRTTLVAGRLERWVQRQLHDHGAIEVTDRARSIGK